MAGRHYWREKYRTIRGLNSRASAWHEVRTAWMSTTPPQVGDSADDTSPYRHARLGEFQRRCLAVGQT